MAKVFAFPLRRATHAGSSLLEIWKGRAQESLGRFLNRAKVPGAVSETTIKDSLTGQELQISVGVLFTRISVNGRDFYFDRVSGKYGGAGGDT
ncbi:MAG: hypothetical protein WA190_08315 [Usitatibacter sp.]